MPETPIKLPAILDLNAAAPLRAEFLSLRGGPLEADASEVQRLGGLCLQVLMSAQATWATDKFPFRITRPSNAFRDTVALFGLAPDVFEPISEIAL